MYIKRLLINDFRNLEYVELQPCSGFNFICGPNGSGKTSVIEAIHYLSLARSFRTSTYQYLIQQGKPQFNLFAQIKEDGLEVDTAIGLARPRLGEPTIKINADPITRMVDLIDHIYVQIIHPQGVELLTKAAEMRRASKYADMFTPMLKLMAGEYSNEVAYDAVQVYGGSGFIKEFSVERLYRDARVTTLYEGPSQMQVVAAARYAVSGVLLGRIREYEADAAVMDIGVKAKVRLRKMTDEFERMCEAVAAMEGDAKSYHARNLVETGARIVIAYLLMMDSKSDGRAALSASVYLDMAEAQNLQAAACITVGGDKEQLECMKGIFLNNGCVCK